MVLLLTNPKEDLEALESELLSSEYLGNPLRPRSVGSPESNAVLISLFTRMLESFRFNEPIQK